MLIKFLFYNKYHIHHSCNTIILYSFIQRFYFPSHIFSPLSLLFLSYFRIFSIYIQSSITASSFNSCLDASLFFSFLTPPQQLGSFLPPKNSSFLDFILLPRLIKISAPNSNNRSSPPTTHFTSSSPTSFAPFFFCSSFQIFQSCYCISLASPSPQVLFHSCKKNCLKATIT